MQLKAEWYKKIKDEGFHDIEDKHQRLKQYDRRTVTFEDRDRVLQFFLDLDAYLVRAKIEPLHRQILELYSDGMTLVEISIRVKKSYGRIRQIISIYKEIIKTSDSPQL